MNYLETMKNIVKDKEKRVENLIFLVIILVILLVSFNYIFSDNKKKNVENGNSTTSTENINVNKTASKEAQDNLESKLANILSQISGIDNVSVVITYASQSTTTPVYNIKEQEKSGEKSVEKSVAYNEQNGSKTAIIESVELPKVEGVIIVAAGASGVEIRSRIASAVSSVTGVPVYKVQVFERQS